MSEKIAKNKEIENLAVGLREKNFEISMSPNGILLNQKREGN